jgi:hypothetical protein
MAAATLSCLACGNGGAMSLRASKGLSGKATLMLWPAFGAWSSAAAVLGRLYHRRFPS